MQKTRKEESSASSDVPYGSRTSETIGKILNDHNIRTFFRMGHTLQQKLTKPKDSVHASAFTRSAAKTARENTLDRPVDSKRLGSHSINEERSPDQLTESLYQNWNVTLQSHFKL